MLISSTIGHMIFGLRSEIIIIFVEWIRNEEDHISTVKDSALSLLFGKHDLT